MKVLIVEDEPTAARRLVKLISALEPDATIVAILDTIKGAVEWIENNPQPSLALFDIHLADGSSFRIFEKTKIKFPVIFTTAYDQYALKAFKVNSIDYLLKPIKKEELAFSLEKLRQHSHPANVSTEQVNELLETLKAKNAPTYKQRFVVSYGDKIKLVDVNDIAWFYSMNKSVFIQTNENKSFGIDTSLDQLEKDLNPEQFFRVNRKYILNIKCIADMYRLSKSRIKIKTQPDCYDDVIVSSERASIFKEWLNQ